jgi:hypothetical protein
MADRIKTDEYTGHRGYAVQDSGDRGEPGLLDPTDAAADQKGNPVPWDDPSFAASRADFVDKSKRLAEAESLLSQASQKLQAGSGVAKPSEADLRKVMASVAGLKGADNAPILRSGEELIQASGYSLIAEHMRILLGQIDPLKTAFGCLQRAVSEDPVHAPAWVAFGLGLLGILPQGARGVIESVLNIKVKDEVTKVVRQLAQHPDDVKAQSVLFLLLTAALRDSAIAGAWRTGPELAEFTALRAEAEKRLPALKAADPERAAAVSQDTSEAQHHLGVHL